MTIEEYENLSPNDAVYFYYPPNPAYMSTINAMIETKIIDSINNDSVVFKSGGVILKALMHQYFLKESDAIAHKLVNIRNLIKKFPTPKLIQKYNNIMNLKKVISISNEYPEIFI